MPSFNQLMARLSDMFGAGSKAIPFANRNLFVDGAFDYWTSTSATPNGSYGAAAMWLTSFGAGGGATFSQVDMRAASGFTDSGTRYAFLHNQTVASTGTLAARTLPFILQRVEGVQRTALKSVTFSCKLWVNSGSNITIPGVVMSQDAGTGGSPAGSTILDKAVNWIVTPTPTKFSVRFDLPSVSGMSFGTNGNDGITCGIWLPGGVTFGLVGTEFQLEFCNPNSSSDLNGKGGAPTTYEYRGRDAELARIERYYFSSYEPGVTPGTANATTYLGQYWSSASSWVGWNITYPSRMRTVPAVSMYSPVTGASGMYRNNNNNADYVAYISANNTAGCTPAPNGNGVSGSGGQICIVADARL